MESPLSVLSQQSILVSDKNLPKSVALPHNCLATYFVTARFCLVDWNWVRELVVVEFTLSYWHILKATRATHLKAVKESMGYHQLARQINQPQPNLIWLKARMLGRIWCKGKSGEVCILIVTSNRTYHPDTFLPLSPILTECSNNAYTTIYRSGNHRLCAQVYCILSTFDVRLLIKGIFFPNSFWIAHTLSCLILNRTWTLCLSSY